ncbi:MAG TPA: hypothetical protein GXX46_02710 [Peptococcaceae bacterium]|nr:hypothetical protein [Peptococcaceae bacterium]
MKFRRNKIKREHSIIKGCLDWLEDLSRLKEVTDIIPGVINVTHSKERGIDYQYETPTGCKLLLKAEGSIQETFVVTTRPEAVKAWVQKRSEELDLLKKALEDEVAWKEKKTEAQQQPLNKNKKVADKHHPKNYKETGDVVANPLVERDKFLAGIKEEVRVVEINQGLRDSFVESLATMADLDNPKLADSLEPEQKKALQKLKAKLKIPAKQHSN